MHFSFYPKATDDLSGELVSGLDTWDLIFNKSRGIYERYYEYWYSYFYSNGSPSLPETSSV